MNDEYLVELVNYIEKATMDVDVEGYINLDEVKKIENDYTPYALKIHYEIEKDPYADEDDKDATYYATGLIIWLKNGLVMGVGVDEGGGTYTYIRPICDFDYTYYNVPKV